MPRSFILSCVLCCGLPFVTSAIPGQEPPATRRPNDPVVDSPTDTDTGVPDQARREDLFRKLMTKVKLTGRFTIEGGNENALQKDDYVISSVVKLGKGDLWLLTSRIRYGTVDLTVPVPVAVRWAGETPVICLDDVSLPGLGTFSARIVLDRGKYAGTWTHDDKGGHMFGTIQPVVADDPGPAPDTQPAAPRTPSGNDSR